MPVPGTHKQPVPVQLPPPRQELFLQVFGATVTVTVAVELLPDASETVYLQGSSRRHVSKTRHGVRSLVHCSVSKVAGAGVGHGHVLVHQDMTNSAAASDSCSC